MSTGQDYPDWLRVEQWVGPPFLNGNQAAIAAGTSFAPFYVGSWEAIAFYVMQTAGAGTAFNVTFNWRVTAGGPSILTTSYNAANGQTIVDAIPVQANYVVISIGGWVGTRDFFFEVIPRRGFNPAVRMDGGDALLYIPSTNIAAGGTATFMLSHVTACRCTFTVHTSAAVWSALINVLNLAGAILGVVGNLGTAAGRGAGSIQVDLPPWPCRVDLNNFDAGVQPFYGGVVPLHT